MPDEGPPDDSLFLDTLRVLTLEAIDAPYMVIGAFAAIVYGSTRVTYDIDIVVDLAKEHIQALVDAYPSPRYYADPQQMRDSIRLGVMFNIIDTSRGGKGRFDPAEYGCPLPGSLRSPVAVTGGASGRGAV